MRSTLAALVLSLSAIAAPPAAVSSPQDAPPPAAARRNADLEERIRAVLAPAAGVYGVSVKHVERNERADWNPDQRFQMASVFKVPILIELFDQARSGRVSLDQRVEWRQPERYFGSGVLTYLQPGLRPTVHDLAVLMITLSDNAATDMLCDLLGIANVNARLRALGASHTSIEGGTRDLILWAVGLRGEQYRGLKRGDKLLESASEQERKATQRWFLEQCPNCTTPADMTSIFEKLLKGEAGDPQSTEEMLRILSRQQFNQRLPRWLPEGVRADHKTGSLGAPVWVINDAGILYLPGGQHVIVSAFGRGVEGQELSPAARKLSTAAAEAAIADVARTVWDYYTVGARDAR